MHAVSELLGVNHRVIPSLLDHAEHARHQRLSAGLTALPADWAHGEPLRVGDKVVFTGCDEALRIRLEKKSEKLGIRVISSVSNKTSVLVTDRSMDGSKAAKARELGTRTEHPTVYATLLEHLQPAPARVVKHVPKSPVPQTPRRSSAHTQTESMLVAADSRPEKLGASPTEVRTWARSHGYEVGTRGRLDQDILTAYVAAHSPIEYHSAGSE